MIRIIKIGIPAIVTLLLLSGCWDQHLLKDAKIFLASSFDVSSDQKILVEVSSPKIVKNQDGGSSVGYALTSGIGNTPREARGDIDRKTAKIFDGSKLRVLIIGNELARKDIYTVLDLFYRDPKSSLSAKIVISETMAKDLLELDIDEQKISAYLYDLLESQETASLVPKENIQSICAEMFDPGEDFVLPYLRADEGGKLAVAEGVALFSERSFTGQILAGDEAKIFLLLDGNAGPATKFTKKVSETEKESFMPSDFVSFNVLKSKQKLKVKVKNHKVDAYVNLRLKIEITDYAKNQLYKKKEVEKLTKKLSETLTKDAVTAVKIIQEANSDSLGIGRRLMALYPDYWKQVDWKKEYPNVTIIPKVEVEIIGNGIIE